MKYTPHRSIGKIFLALACAGSLGYSSATATVWDLNPTSANAPVGSSTQIFTSEGYQITARGYDNNNGSGVAHDLFFKQQDEIGGAGEHGLGLNGTDHYELNLANGVVANFIQLDVTSILMQGFVNGMVQVGSVQAGESFQLFGSNTLGALGISLGGAYGFASDDQFVLVPSFGSYKFISIAAASGDVLPVAFSAVPPAGVPDSGSALSFLGAAFLGVAVLRRKFVKA